MRFSVIDLKTGLPAIAANESWASRLIGGMDGFALLETGELVMLDECGNYAYCPAGRFKVVVEQEESAWRRCWS